MKGRDGKRGTARERTGLSREWRARRVGTVIELQKEEMGLQAEQDGTGVAGRWIADYVVSPVLYEEMF